MKYGIGIKTLAAGGRPVHSTYNIGKGEEIPEDIVEMQKKLNAALWHKMPEGSFGLVSEIYYKRSPKASKKRT